jgi:hypothetical protein
MQRKMARSAPPPPFGPPGEAAVVRAASLACQNAVKGKNSCYFRSHPRNPDLGSIMTPSKLVKRLRIDDPDRFRLAAFDPADTGGLDKDDAQALLADDVKASPSCSSASMPTAAGRCSSCSRGWMPPARTASSTTS